MMFNEHTFLDRFQAAADAGFKAVEYLFPYDDPADTVAGRLEGCRAGTGALQHAARQLVGRRPRAGRQLPDLAQEFRASVDTAIRYARVIGTPLLHDGGARRCRDPEAVRCYRNSLRYAAERTRKRVSGS